MSVALMAGDGPSLVGSTRRTGAGELSVDRRANKLFLKACGPSGPLHLHLEGQGSLGGRMFEQPFVVAGRDP
jgi:hypothetical protein